MGLVTIMKAAKNLLFFIKAKSRIGASMVRMLVEQCVSASAVILFSANSLITATIDDAESWYALEPYMGNVLGFIMCCAMLESTHHLSTSVRQILDGDV